jgi:hypothetical protein
VRDMSASDRAVDPAIDIGVEPASTSTAITTVSAEQHGWASIAHKADFFLVTHGRQAMHKDSAPKALHIEHLLTSDALWWVTTALLAIGIAVLVLHRHFRSHHLRSRIRYDLLPATTFEPSAPAVLGFAHQLGRVRPVHGWVPKSAVGVRVRFRTDGYGKMIMSVEGRQAVAGVLNKLTYPQVDIRRDVTVGLDERGEISPSDQRGENSGAAR